MAKSKQAMKQVLGIRDEKTRMKVTLPLAMAPVTQEDDMRCNPMHVSPIVRGAVLVRARACEPVSKRSL